MPDSRRSLAVSTLLILGAFTVIAQTAPTHCMTTDVFAIPQVPAKVLIGCAEAYPSGAVARAASARPAPLRKEQVLS